jgi:hypothetical protein
MRYKNIDGIWEIGIGFMGLTMPLLENSLKSAPRNSVWHWHGTLGLSVALLGFVVLCGVRVLKKRITYPRTGFVKYRGLAGKPWVVSAIAGAIAIPVTIYSVFLWRHLPFSVMVAVESSMWGLLYAFATKLDRAYRWIALVVMVAGPVAISTLPLDHEWLGGLHVGFLGLTLFVSGVITLYLYLRRTQPAEQEAE